MYVYIYIYICIHTYIYIQMPPSASPPRCRPHRPSRLGGLPGGSRKVLRGPAGSGFLGGEGGELPL